MFFEKNNMRIIFFLQYFKNYRVLSLFKEYVSLLYIHFYDIFVKIIEINIFTLRNKYFLFLIKISKFLYYTQYYYEINI